MQEVRSSGVSLTKKNPNGHFHKLDIPAGARSTEQGA
jgi:hypothetical protein